VTTLTANRLWFDGFENEVANVTVAPGNFLYCVGTTNTFTASSTLGGLSYSWSAQGGDVLSTSGSQNQTAQIVFTTPGFASIMASANGGSLLGTATGAVVGVQMDTSNPERVCVSYTYINGTYVLISITNQVNLSATGTPNDPTGIYTWSHSRGGTFSTNNCPTASTVTYSAPELASATPPSMTDTVTVTYTYHGVSCTNSGVLNITRPQQLVAFSYGPIASPSCTSLNGTGFETDIKYHLYDQFGVEMNYNGGPLAIFETFSNCGPGGPVYGTGMYNGIETGLTNTLQMSSGNITTPSNRNVYNASPIGPDRFYITLINYGYETLWNASSASNPIFKGDQTYTIQGAQFQTGTLIEYCYSTPTNSTGAQLLRGGVPITNGTTINASN
jgi:hypothetical protein